MCWEVNSGQVRKPNYKYNLQLLYNLWMHKPNAETRRLPKLDRNRRPLGYEPLWHLHFQSLPVKPVHPCPRRDYTMGRVVTHSWLTGFSVRLWKGKRFRVLYFRGVRFQSSFGIRSAFTKQFTLQLWCMEVIEACFLAWAVSLLRKNWFYLEILLIR